MYPPIKRFGDLLLIALFTPIIIPLYLVISFLVFCEFGFPILFSQERLGYQNQEFEILKFRSMTNQRDKDGNLFPDSKRLTTFGKILRKSSLDEIPCIINVLKGQMSIVGPRPFISKYKSLYSAEQIKRHQVKPGITGLAQVNGRNAISWEEKFNFDLEYVRNQSFALDFIILIKTIKIVLYKSGVNESEGITMTEFKGTKLE